MNTSHHDAQKALARIRLMLPRTDANGASPAEVRATQQLIGRLIMKFPQLLTADSPPAGRPRPKPHDTEDVTFAHSGILSRTDKAVMLLIRGQEAWFPLSQLTSLDDHYVSMYAWLAKAKGLI